MKKEDAKALILQEWRTFKSLNKNWNDSDKLIFSVKIKDTYTLMGWISADPTNKLDS